MTKLESNMSPTPSPPKPTLLTLPLELRHQIYNHAFSNLTLQAFASHNHMPPGCTWCYTAKPALTLSPPPPPPPPQLIYPLYSTHVSCLLANKQLYTEASPIFSALITLFINDAHTLSKIRTSTHHTLRSSIRNLILTVHLNETTRLDWHTALSNLTPNTFPHLTSLRINNHMRAPNSYDCLLDTIYLCSPLVTFPPALQRPPGLILQLDYMWEETMFESPLLGDITTEDAREAHEGVVWDLLADEEFRAASVREEGDGGVDVEPDFETMTGRLWVVAKGREEGWLEGLQRRRLGGLTVSEVVEGVRRGEIVGMGSMGPAGAGDGENEEIDETGWTALDWAGYLRMVREREERQATSSS